MKLIQVISTLNPAFGGPSEGLKQMSLALKKQGHEVLVVTLDDPKATWLRDSNINIVALGPSVFKYGFNLKLVKWLKANAKAYDAVIVNGVWQYHSFGVWIALRKLKIPYFVYTHGMLDPWFRSAFPLKHLKKVIYWYIIEHKVLAQANRVIFTTEEEMKLAKYSFRPCDIKGCVINFGISAPIELTDTTKILFHEKYPELKNKKCILFLSRIHQKKGCDLLIKAFSMVYKLDHSYHLVIIGNDQEGLRYDFEILASNHGISDRITWAGMVSEIFKWSAYNACEVFMLPSHSENFGSAVVEAMSVGKPVLISNKVNICREIQNYKAGFVENDDLNGAVNLLVRWSLLTDSEKSDMGLAAKECFNEIFDIKSAASNLTKNLEVFLV